jgi:hypothetical protein
LAIRVEWRDDEFPAAIKTSVTNVDARIIEQLDLQSTAARFYDVAAPAPREKGVRASFFLFRNGFLETKNRNLSAGNH